MVTPRREGWWTENVIWMIQVREEKKARERRKEDENPSLGYLKQFGWYL